MTKSSFQIQINRSIKAVVCELEEQAGAESYSAGSIIGVELGDQIALSQRIYAALTTQLHSQISSAYCRIGEKLISDVLDDRMEGVVDYMQMLAKVDHHLAVRVADDVVNELELHFGLPRCHEVDTVVAAALRDAFGAEIRN